MRDDVTILVKTFCRPWPLCKFLRSARKHVPDVPIVVVDDGHPKARKVEKLPAVELYVDAKYDIGLSAGRNLGLDKIATPYFMLCDDDFQFDENHPLYSALEYLPTTDLDILCFRMWDPRAKGPGGYNSLFKKAGRVLRRKQGHRGRERDHVNVDMGLNCFIAKTEAVKRVRWDADLKVCEHWDFFWRAKKKGLKVGVYQVGYVRHCKPKIVRKVYQTHRHRPRFGRLACRKNGFVRYVN